MKKNLIFILIISIAVLVAAFGYWQRRKSLPKEAELTPKDAAEKMMGLDLINSPMKRVVVPDIDLALSNLTLNQLSVQLPDLSLEKAIEIQAPAIKIGF